MTAANTNSTGYLVKLTGTLLLISVVVAGLLGLTNHITADKIAAINEEKAAASMEEVLPADSYTELTYTGSDPNVTAIYEAAGQGYVVEVSPSGFGGAIDMMAGINSAGEVTGLAIITHAETSGLGSKATDPEWQAQFAGATDIVSVTKDGGTIEAITGSTITSRAVCDGVNAARAVVEALG